MSEMDETEFLERIVKNNQEFVTRQISAIRTEMSTKISTLERQCQVLEQELHNQDILIKRLASEMPLHAKAVLKDLMEAGIKSISDNADMAENNQSNVEQGEVMPQEKQQTEEIQHTSTPDPPAKRRKVIEPFKFTRQKRISVVEKMKKAVRSAGDPEGFKSIWISNEKERGVITTKFFQRGDFLLQYKGKFHSTDPGDGCYIFEAKCGKQSFWLDATAEDISLGRLVNDDHINPSAVAKLCQVDGMPCICFYACRDISIGEEIAFNYSGTKNVNDFSWRSCVRHGSLNK